MSERDRNGTTAGARPWAARVRSAILFLSTTLLLLTSQPLFAVDNTLVKNLRWRTSDASATQRYFWLLLAAAALCFAIWLSYTLYVRVATRMRRKGRRRQSRFPQRPVTPTAPYTPSAPAWKVSGIDTSTKARAVIRLIQGEDVDEVANELGVTTALLRDWVERFLRAGRLSLDPESSWSPGGRV
ncbi:MAG: helix-turn-helix domain-containing protein [Planctomycetota bacterium]